MIHDEGAYTPQGINLPYNASTALPGPYVLPAYELDVRWSRPTRSPPCRCAAPAIRKARSRWSACSTRSRASLQLDRAEVRRRNLVPAGEDALRDAAEDARRLADHARQRRLSGLSAARAGRDRLCRFRRAPGRRAREGRYLGIGIGNGIKGTGRGPFESGIVRIGRSGRISVYTGAMPMGQGIKTALAQICAEQFGVVPTT